MRVSQRTAFGMFTQVTTCNRCRGQGTFVETPCPSCRGRGVVEKKRNIEIKIPRGIDDGNQLRLERQGEAPLQGKGPSGDLYVVVHIKPHRLFQRKGLHLYRKLNISFPDAVLGNKIELNTLSGVEKLKIPEGVESGTVLTLSGKGMPNLHGRGFGNLFVELHVTTPKHLSRKTKKLMEELRDELT